MEEPVVLASASPRRTEILSRAGIAHVVAPVDADESLVAGDSPDIQALTIARRKAEAAAPRWPGRWVLAADTIVDVGGVPLGKPADDSDARRMLGALSGRPHAVHTGLALVTPSGTVHTAVESTRVHVRTLTPEVIDRYVASGEPRDKAGAYAIQGLGSLLIDRIDGAYDNVVGLPLARLLTLFAEARHR
ncbi:MAG TPA: Maf family protein [Candidatus Eisenbacteria bacterium]